MNVTRSIWLRLFLALLFGSGVVTITGCADSADGDSHSHAEGEEHGGHEDHGDGDSHEEKSFEESVAELSQMKEVICEAFANGTPDEAHDALHGVGHLLESLPELASKELSLDEGAMESLDAAVESLFDGFGQLDETFHGGDEVDAAQISEDLSDAIAQMKAAVQ
ncbi:MAG: hypothetical protein Aurels2KO_37830 [Aureliella sp.]